MNVEKFWDDMAERYAKSPVRDEELYQEKLKKTQEYFTEESQVLEWGCGTGTTSVHHAPYVKHILATDISQNMLDIGKKRAAEAGHSNVSFQRSTVEEFDAESNSFDAILALNIVHLLDDPTASINKAYKLLKPGGVFVSSTVCLGDVIFSMWRIMIPVMQLVGKAPSVQYMKRQKLEIDLENAGFITAYARPAKKGEAAFIISRKPD